MSTKYYTIKSKFPITILHYIYDDEIIDNVFLAGGIGKLTVQNTDRYIVKSNDNKWFVKINNEWYKWFIDSEKWDLQELTKEQAFIEEL